MVTTVESGNVYYLHLTDHERQVLSEIEHEVIDFVRDSLGSSCRPIWSAVDDHGVRMIRLAVADIPSVIAISVHADELAALTDASLFHFLEANVADELVETYA